MPVQTSDSDCRPMRWPDAQSLWTKSLGNLLATLSQDFLAITRQFDDVVCGEREVAEEFARQQVGDA